MELSVLVALTAVGVLQLAGGVLLYRQGRSVARMSARLANLTAGLSLLTDTTETGLRDVAAEIGRMATVQAPRPRPRAATQRRMAGAARRGRSVQEIAADEGVSEGEVNLRLQLAEAGARQKKAAELGLA